MKFKLDENFGTRTQKIFEAKGFDVETVSAEELNGAPDDIIFNVCKSEKRCLVTLDKDFSDIIRYSPINTSGIIILRLPQNPSVKMLENLVETFLTEIKYNSPEHSVWIVEPGKIRIKKPEN